MSVSIFYWLPALPEVLLLGLGAVVLLLGLWIHRYRFEWVYALTQFSVLATLSVLAYVAFQAQGQGSAMSTAFYGNFLLDRLSILLKVAMLSMTWLLFIYGRGYTKRHFSQAIGEYYALHLFAVVGMMILVSAQTLLTVFLGLELFSLPLYALVGLRRETVVSTEAALKYFVLGALSTGMLLYGFSLLYGMSHSIGLHDIATSLSHLNTIQLRIGLLALVLVVLGVAFKLGVVPCHMWVPDVYEGAPTSVTVFIASVGKLATFGLLIRLLVQTMPALDIKWQSLLVGVGLLSIAGGNIAALLQSNFKRLLAYSSIAHMGYMLLGVLVADSLGYGLSLFYLLVYTFITVAAFGWLLMREHWEDKTAKLSEWAGLNRSEPVLAFFMLVILFALAGIPPFAGFMAKFGVLTALLHDRWIVLAALAMLLAVVGAYYYIRVVKIVYFDQPVSLASDQPIEEASQSLAYPMTLKVLLGLQCFIVLLVGLFPSRLIALCQSVF